MAKAQKTSTTRTVVKTVEVEEVVDTYTLTLTEEEAQILILLTGRCVSGPEYGIYDTLKRAIPADKRGPLNNPFVAKSSKPEGGWGPCPSLRVDRKNDDW